MKKIFFILLISVISFSAICAQTAKNGGVFFELGASALYTTEHLNTTTYGGPFSDTLGAGAHVGIGIRSDKGNSMFMLDADLNFTLLTMQSNSHGSRYYQIPNPVDFLQFNASPSITFFLVDVSKFKLGIGPSLNFSLNVLKTNGKQQLDMLFGVGANLTGMVFFTNNVYLNFGVRVIYNPFELVINANQEKIFGLTTHISVIPKLGIGFKF